tara:strand:- start:37608 stop:37973 length:366 start_codon:yes stop_codon:yes gene_type:complete
MKYLKQTTPFFIESPTITKLLSKIAPININAITLGPLVISSGPLSKEIKRHETIHWQQYLDCFIIGFPILYLLYWLKGLFIYRDARIAYLLIPFEQEAYCKEHIEDYLVERKRYSWLYYKM